MGSTGADALTPRSRCGEIPLPQSEQRRPGRAAVPTDDELLNDSGDELLRWANDVLRKAQNQETTTHKATSVPSMVFTVPQAPPGAPPTSRRPRRPQSPSVEERRRKAEMLRDEMRRLQEESRQECERLASEEESWRRKLASDQDESWRRRLSSMAEEMRANLSRPPPGLRSEDMRGRIPRGASAPPPMVLDPAAAAAARASEHDAAWMALEARLEAADSRPIRFADVPWPEGSASITGVLPSDAAPVAKRKLTAALRRWHPDKWRRIVDRVPEAERARVMERVKTVAQRLLEEKARLAGPGGVLR